MEGPVSESWDIFLPDHQQDNISKWHQGPGCCMWTYGPGRLCLDLTELSSLCDFMIPEVERADLLKGWGL